MPHWTLVLILVIAGWLLMSVVGGFAIGRLLELVSRHSQPPHRRVA